MKVIHYAIYLFSLYQIVPAQLSLLAGYPQCAVTCLLQYYTQTSCAPTDLPCLCQSQILQKSATECTMQKCTTREALTSQSLSKKACGVPVRNKSTTLPLTTTILTGVSAIFLSIRIIARSPRKFEFLGWDDGYILLCFFAGIPLTISHFYLARNGIGQDVWNVSFRGIDQILFWFYVAEPFYLASTVLVKISILCFYLRVFIDRQFRTLVYVVMAFCVAYAIAFLFLLTFQCSPISYIWTHWDNQAKGKCVNIKAGVWSHAAINIFFDLVVLVLPIPKLIKLQFTYTWRSKAQIGFMFSVGLLVTIVSCLRLQNLIQFGQTLNPTWDYFGAALWSGIEVWVGVICACLPAVRQFFDKMLPERLGLSSQSKGTSGSGQSARLHRKPPPPKQMISWQSSHETAVTEQDGGSFVELKSLPGKDDHRPGTAA